MDLDTSARADSQIDSFIERRDRERRREEGERPAEEMWAESERRYYARQERELRAQWYGYHFEQAERHRRTLEALIAHHELEAQKHCEENGNGHKKGA